MAMLEVSCPACRTVASFDGQVSFRAECEACAADLHVCITCRFYDRYVESACREPTADPVQVKDRRNLCEYYKPRTQHAGDDDAQAAKAKLRALFGEAGPEDDSPPPSAEDAAKQALADLFKK